MTRSDNPFGDLPEWKERQRLQEAQQQAGGQPVDYAQPAPFGHAPVPQHVSPQEHGGAAVQSNADAQQHAPDGRGYYHQEPSLTSSPLHYNVAGEGHPLNEDAYEPQLQAPSSYEHHGYSAHPNERPAQSYAAPGQGPLDYGHGSMEPQAGVGYGAGDGVYDDNGPYHPASVAPAAHAVPGLRPGYDGNHFQPGQPGVGPDGEPTFYDPSADNAGGHWQAGQVGAAGSQPAQGGYDDEYDEDEDDYYDDDIDDGTQRYSWKMLAAVVVTGAVVTGGGVVLYDSFMGGGSGASGNAPIIRAEQAPAKTVPVNSGGRQFGNRDSKLLGRLDNANGSKVTRTLEDSNVSGNRVRSVPTVRIGRDGRLILPKAPEAVTAPEAGGKQVAAVSGARVAPGINVVESIGSDGAGGLGAGLPQAVPQQAASQAAPVATTPKAPATPSPRVAPARSEPAAPKVAALKREPVVPAARSGGGLNRAIAPKAGPPPVPSKSSLGSAWRMTKANAETQAPTNTGAIQPTIARPVQWQAKPNSEAPSRAAPKLGASNVAQTQNRKYVAVLATAPTRMKALQSFAELQQKHPNALLNRVPDVQRADLSARGLGIMYRVVVGPAGSRSSASSVCSSLKSEGYAGCWVKNN